MTAGSPPCIHDMERGREEAGLGGVVARPMGSCAHKHTTLTRQFKETGKQGPHTAYNDDHAVQGNKEHTRKQVECQMQLNKSRRKRSVPYNTFF